MNLIERDMLTRCLGPIYEQMLMGDTDAALASIEGVTWLVRYMAAGKSSQRATLENELRRCGRCSKSAGGRWDWRPVSPAWIRTWK